MQIFTSFETRIYNKIKLCIASWMKNGHFEQLLSLKKYELESITYLSKYFHILYWTALNSYNAEVKGICYTCLIWL